MGRGYRRRRARVAWLPNLPFASDGGEPLNIAQDAIQIDSGGKTSTRVFPLIKDEAPDPLGQSLSDYTQGGYLLKRIVGKLFVGMQQRDEGEPEAHKEIPNCIVTASFEILRTDVTNNPTGSVNADVNYNSLLEDNERDPWIWQRSWCLSNGNSTIVPAGTGSSFGFYPYTNVEYGSVADGPHVDAKTARRVGPDERLFLCITTTCLADYTASWPTVQDGGIDFLFQYRVLGVPIKMSNRKNTSR